MFIFAIIHHIIQVQNKIKDASKVVTVPLGNNMIPIYAGAIAEEKESKMSGIALRLDDYEKISMILYSGQSETEANAILVDLLKKKEEQIPLKITDSDSKILLDMCFMTRELDPEQNITTYKVYIKGKLIK